MTVAAARASAGGAGLAFWLALAVAIVVLDQFTKTLILGWFQYGEVRPVTSFFNLVRVHNTGAAFSFLAGASGWQRWFFVGIGAAASVFIVWMLKKHPTQTLFCFAVTLILGGAVGNVVDRLLHGYVVDFLQFRFGVLEPIFRGGYFPSFNVADAAITVGAASLILDEILRVRRAR
ncbi:signal peptidase II [Azohydromonas sp.]|uniref:signal peptidase II n=1 Tax=Azohydromonas sp. TaxID=1872666 RepID=UPI002C832F6F|nr:signal peptidase II [Azohydromonas sp.]HMM86564.1 signal peptidase II [Azohydromonas sp.]